MLRLSRHFLRSLFVRTEATPNENSLKFCADELSAALRSARISSMEFVDEEAARRAPLARAILSLPYVRSVFYGTDFVTVEKEAGIPWPALKPQISAVIMDHLQANESLVEIDSKNLQTKEEEREEIETDDPKLLEQVQAMMDARIRPVIQEDGGDVSIVAIRKGYVHLKLRGACRSCSSSTITLRNGIENMLMHYIEGVKGIVQVSDEVEEGAKRAFDEFEKSHK